MIELSHVYFVGADLQKGSALGAPAARTNRNRRLSDRARRTKPPDNLSREPVSALIAQVLRQSGLEVSAYQPKALQRRLGACLRSLRAGSEAAGISALAENPEVLPAALSALLIGVSQFFRDSMVFAYLGEAALPAVLRQYGGARVYSFGCSGGQELYSVAILLEELGGLTGSQLLGVDCRTEAIAQARAGWFDLADLETLSGERRQCYFIPDGGRSWILPRLQAPVHWRVATSGAGPAGVSWDVILFRNVAIYLEAEAAGDLWRRLVEQLRPGGVLVTGKAERPPAGLGLVREAACVYRKPLR